MIQPMNFGIDNLRCFIQFGGAFVGFIDENFRHPLNGDGKRDYSVICKIKCLFFYDKNFLTNGKNYHGSSLLCCEYVLIEIKGANNTDDKFKKLLKYSWNSFKQDFSLQYLLLQNINTRRYSKVLRNYLYIFIKIPYY